MIFKVLIVDDDYINRRLLVSFLKKELYKIEIIESIDGKEALEICRQNKDIQLILLDVEMPRMDGAEFLKHYIKDKTLPKIPIIAVSSNDLRVKEIINLGADSFLVKPVTEEKILAAIRETQTA
jgi:putative two-component system response regulator